MKPPEKTKSFYWHLLHYIPASSIVASLILKVWSSHWSSGVTSIENRAKFLSAESILVSSKSSSPSPNFRKKKKSCSFSYRFPMSIIFQKLIWPFDIRINCSKGQLISKADLKVSHLNQKYFCWFLIQMNTFQSAFEINWPLEISNFSIPRTIFLIIGQNKFWNKIPFLFFKK